MVIKRMCDQCGAELDGAAAPHGNHGSTEGNQTEGLQIKHGDIRVRLTAGRSGHPIGTGDWCKYCMLDAVAKLDDRPQNIVDIGSMQRQIEDQRPRSTVCTMSTTSCSASCRSAVEDLLVAR